MASIRDLKPHIRLSFSNPNSNSGSMFGKGIADLCLGVRTLGSLNAAAKSMGMAYSKAWRIIKETEEALGFQLLIRDGAHGSVLSENGDHLLDAYLMLNDKLSQEALELFEEIRK